MFIIIMYFYVLFLWIVAHGPFESKEPKHSQNKLLLTQVHTHTYIHTINRWDFKDGLKDVSVFDDLTLKTVKPQMI